MALEKPQGVFGEIARLFQPENEAALRQHLEESYTQFSQEPYQNDDPILRARNVLSAFGTIFKLGAISRHDLDNAFKFYREAVVTGKFVGLKPADVTIEKIFGKDFLSE